MTIAAADQGTGATIAFTTSAFLANITKIGGFEITRDAVEITHLLSTTYKRYQAADLAEPPELEIEFQYDPDTQPPILGAAETVTITMPKPAAYTTAATVAGTAFCTSFTHAELVPNQVMMGKAKFKFDGGTGPTFTDHT